MPNHVTHKILFDARKSQGIFSAVCPDGKFDFRILVPRPLHIYLGDTGKEHEEDFGELTWYSWNRTNWGTKWNCYDQSCGIDEDGLAFIKFDTAWSIPYPIIIAFANKFQVPFMHKYFDEGSNYWGIENWGFNVHDTEDKRLIRTTKQYKLEKDEAPLCMELKGWELEEEN